MSEGPDDASAAWVDLDAEEAASPGARTDPAGKHLDDFQKSRQNRGARFSDENLATYEDRSMSRDYNIADHLPGPLYRNNTREAKHAALKANSQGDLTGMALSIFMAIPPLCV